MIMSKRMKTNRKTVAEKFAEDIALCDGRWNDAISRHNPDPINRPASFGGDECECNICNKEQSCE